MVRTATVADAEQLNALNNEFNGEGETTLENIRNCLSCTPQEVVIVDEDQGRLTGSLYHPDTFCGMVSCEGGYRTSRRRSIL